MTTDAIRHLLHALAGALIWPVLVALVLLAAATLVRSGGFVREAWDRHRGRRRALQAADEWARQISRIARNREIYGPLVMGNGLYAEAEILAGKIEDDLDVDFDRIDMAVESARGFRDLVRLAMPAEQDDRDA